MNELVVRKINGSKYDIDPEWKVFEVQDDDTKDGIFYLVVNTQEKEVGVYSVDKDGNPIRTDLFRLTQRVEKEPEEEDRTEQVTWKGDVTSTVGQLLGRNAANVVLMSLGLPKYDGPDPETRPERADFDGELRDFTTMTFTFPLEQEDEHSEDAGEAEPMSGGEEMPPGPPEEGKGANAPGGGSYLPGEEGEDRG